MQPPADQAHQLFRPPVQIDLVSYDLQGVENDILFEIGEDLGHHKELQMDVFCRVLPIEIGRALNERGRGAYQRVVVDRVVFKCVERYDVFLFSFLRSQSAKTKNNR
jgi:hypothetical protein